MKYTLSILISLMASPVSADCVILLHGLARSSTSFLVMEKKLQGIGYDTVNIDYPSRRGSIPELAAQTLPKAITQCDPKDNMHFVTHSMGGILVRYHLEHMSRPKNLRHVVMLGPPNKGSAVVDQLGDFPGFKVLNGQAGKQLSTDSSSIPNQLGAVDYSLGVIAGTQSISPVFSSILKGPDDGKVSVESTKVAGMSDHIILPVTHTFMMNSPLVFKQVAHYLREGQFKH